MGHVRAADSIQLSRGTVAQIDQSCIDLIRILSMEFRLEDIMCRCMQLRSAGTQMACKILLFILDPSPRPLCQQQGWCCGWVDNAASTSFGSGMTITTYVQRFNVSVSGKLRKEFCYLQSNSSGLVLLQVVPLEPSPALFSGLAQVARYVQGRW